jgi:hypothetical protein
MQQQWRQEGRKKKTFGRFHASLQPQRSQQIEMQGPFERLKAQVGGGQAVLPVAGERRSSDL